VEEGAQTPLHLAASMDVDSITGKYFDDRMPVKAASQAYDQDAAQRLWQVSAALTSP